MATARKAVFGQFTKVQSIHPGFYKLEMKDKNQKKFIPKLAIDSEFFIAHLPILVQCKTEGAV
jgi:hypothetical protein